MTTLQKTQRDNKTNNAEKPSPSKEPTSNVRAISARIEKDLYKQLKYLSFEKERKLNEIIETALRTYIKAEVI